MNNKEQTAFRNFTFFGDYLANIQDLPANEQNEIIVAVVRYTSAGEQPEFSKPYLTAIFNCIKFSLDKSVSAANRGQGRKTNDKKTEIKTESNQNQSEIKKESNGNQTAINENKNIEQEREREKEKEKTRTRYSSIDDLNEQEIHEISKRYRVAPAFVRNCLDDLRNYCASRGKTYKNYRAALCNFVKSDLNKGAKNASQLATPGLFQKPEDNPDLARQNESPPPKKPMGEEEIKKLRAAMPKIIRDKIEAREKAAMINRGEVNNAN